MGNVSVKYQKQNTKKSNHYDGLDICITQTEGQNTNNYVSP